MKHKLKLLLILFIIVFTYSIPVVLIKCNTVVTTAIGHLCLCITVVALLLIIGTLIDMFILSIRRKPKKKIKTSEITVKVLYEDPYKILSQPFERTFKGQTLKDCMDEAFSIVKAFNVKILSVELLTTED
jgi:hypothetical protein